MKKLSDYVLQVKKEYPFKIRLLDCILDDDQMNRLETLLKKYELIEIEAPEKTIFQKNPLGFKGPIQGEVTIVSVILGIPVSKENLMWDVCELFKIPRNYVCIHNSYDDLVADDLTKVQDDLSSKPNEQQDKKEQTKEEVEHKDVYGDKYNEDMINTIEDSRKEALKNINKLAEK